MIRILPNLILQRARHRSTLITAALAVVLVTTVGLLPAGGRRAFASPVSAKRIVVVAAENEYGSMVSAIGGNQVQVTSLLTNPNTDPHEFEASASTARSLGIARLVIKNGIGYDAWIDKLLSASPRSQRLVFSVGEYLGHKAGDNPHVWYDSTGWVKEANVITADLIKIDPQHRAYFQQRSAAWLRSLRPVYQEIATVRRVTKGKAVIATEPVYGYMIAALGASSLDYDFQKAIMDGTDPSPRAVADFEAALQHHAVHMLFYNRQVVGPTTSSMRSIAVKSHVPIVGVTETQPPGISFVRWQLSQLQSVRQHWK